MDDSPAVSVNAAPSVDPRSLRGVAGFARRQVSAHRTLIKFAAVGAIGYVVYLAAIFLLYDLQAFPFLPNKDTRVDLGLFTHDDALLLVTTLVGTQASIVAVFIGHSLWTFADRDPVDKPLWLRFLQFEGRALFSTLLILSVAVNVLALAAGIHPAVAVPVGLVAAFTWNWLWDSKVIWRARHTRELS